MGREMKSLIVVVDTSYPGEYSLINEVLKKAGTEVNVGIVSKNVNVNYNVDLTEKVMEESLGDYDVLAFVGGYWTYFAVTGKKIPKRINPVVSTEALDKLLTYAVNSGKKTILPLVMPAYASKLGLLKGRKATVYLTTDLIRILKENGVEFISDPIVVDGSLITMSTLNLNELIRVCSNVVCQ